MKAQSRPSERRADLAEAWVAGPADTAASSPGEELGCLAAAARQGDQDALQALYGRYRPLLGSVVAGIRRRLPAGVESDDLAQEAARQFCELVHAFDPARGTNLTTYLQKKLKWRIANFLRDEMRRSRHLPLEAAPLHRLADELARSSSPDLASPRLARALGRLSPRQRTVIAGVYWQDRTTGELARRLGVTPQAVTALRRRAEAALRRELAER